MFSEMFQRTLWGYYLKLNNKLTSWDCKETKHINTARTM